MAWTPFTPRRNPLNRDRPISKYDRIIESPDDSSGTLTFGIELEFLVPVLKNGFSDRFPSDKRLLLNHTYHFEEADKIILGVIVNASDLQFRPAGCDEFRSGTSGVVLYDKWRLVHEPAIGFPINIQTEYSWLEREITSEVLRSDDPRTYTEKITRVCRAIRKLRVHLNDTTSVHVHVGLGDEPFSLLTIKKAVTLILFVDDILMQLHHPCRRYNSYCELVSRRSNLSKLDPNIMPEKHKLYARALEQRMSEFVPTVPHEQQTLQASSSIVELAVLLNAPGFEGYYRGSVSFAKFIPVMDVGGNTETIEFRQMAGCLDPSHIIHWAKVCMSIIDFARLSNPGQYKALLGKIIARGPTFSALDLLLELGLVEEERFFRAKVASYQSNLDFYPGQSSGLLFVPELE